MVNNRPDSEGLQANETIDMTMSINDDDEYVAFVQCAVKSCTKIFELMKDKNRWSTTNYYRHIRSHKKKSNSQTNSSNDFLRTGQTESTVSDAVTNNEKEKVIQKRKMISDDQEDFVHQAGVTSKSTMVVVL